MAVETRRYILNTKTRNMFGKSRKLKMKSELPKLLNENTSIVLL